MKLFLECSEYPPGRHGGIGTLVQILARGLVKAGHQVRVAGLYPASSSAPDYEEDEGVRVWRLRIPEWALGWIFARRRLFNLVRGWCRAGEVDLIDVPDWCGPAAGWGVLPVPMVVRLSGSASFFAKEMGRDPARVMFLLERKSLRRADFICSNSRYIGERTKEIFDDRSPDAVLYPPVEMPDLDPEIKRDPNMVVFAGTLAKKKGVISLVESWPAVNKGFPEATLHIWGKDGKSENGGSMRQYLSSLLPAAVRESVHFHDHVPLHELLPVFQSAGMAVLPSYAEGFALTPLHAMSAGCPTIYSTRGSGLELIENGENGILIDPDRTDQISDAILTLLRNRELADRMGERGQRLVEQRFAWPVVRAANEDFYRQCVKEFKRVGSGRTREAHAAIP